MKIFTAVVIIIMLALIGVTIYLAFQTDSPFMEADQNIDNNEVPQSEEVGTLPENWQSYANDNFDFTFLYPAGATQSIEAERAKITVLGANNTANSEITDGFTFFVRTEDMTADSSLSEFANDLYELETARLEGVQEPIRRVINGKTLYEFKVETELGPVATRAILEADEDSVFVVEYLISGSSESSYQDTVDIMLGSLELNPELNNEEEE